MKITTIPDISFAQWIEQSSRFTSGLDVLLARNLPQNTETSGKAEIEIKLNKPLFERFDATITYKQHYTTTVILENTEFLNPQVLPIIKYRKEMDYETVKATFEQVESMVDASIVGLDRVKQLLATAVLGDVVQKSTFGGLGLTDYEIEI